MESKSRNSVVAACLFLGGLTVGSLPSAYATSSGKGAPPAAGPDAKAASGQTAGPTFAKGGESPALRALREAARHGYGADRDDILAPEWGKDWGRDKEDRASSGPREARGDGLGERRGEDADDAFAGLHMPQIPIRRHRRVMKYVRYFSENHEGRKFFVAALRRSGRVQELVAKSLRAAGLPQELVAVAFVESGFAPQAVSSAGAVGIWQFMPQTGRAYGLVVERGYDERASLWHATEAATRHLGDLHERFRSWDLAFAAYNLGYEGLTRRMEELGTDDFWTLSDVPGALPKETAHYVPKVLAVALLLNNLEEFGFTDVERAPAVDASELEVAGGTRLSLVARASATSLRTLRELNPELLTEVVPDRGAPVVLHVPRSGLSRARVMLPRLIGEAEDGAREKPVSADFDWGKDELADGRSRLERTRRSASYFKDETAARDTDESRVGGERAPWLERSRSAAPERHTERPRGEGLAALRARREDTDEEPPSRREALSPPARSGRHADTAAPQPTRRRDLRDLRDARDARDLRDLRDARDDRDDRDDRDSRDASRRDTRANDASSALAPPQCAAPADVLSARAATPASSAPAALAPPAAPPGAAAPTGTPSTPAAAPPPANRAPVRRAERTLARAGEPRDVSPPRDARAPSAR